MLENLFHIFSDIRPLISCDSELSPPDLTGFPRGGGLLPNELFPQFSSSSANVAMHLPSMPTTTTIKDEPRGKIVIIMFVSIIVK